MKNTTFMIAYDMFVNELFVFFSSQTKNRQYARYLTHSTFKKTWKNLVQDELCMSPDINNVHNLLYLNARKLARLSKYIPIPALMIE